MKKVIQKSLLCLTLNVLLCQSIFAQQDVSQKNHLGLSLGISNYHSKDLMLSPLIYRGNNFSIGLTYLHKRKTAFHTVDISFAIGDINSEVSYHTQTGVRGHIWYGYSRQITKFSLKDRAIPIFIGGLLKLFFDSAEEQDFNNNAHIVAYSLNINLGLQYIIKPRHSLHWELHFPVLSYVVRPPYASTDEYTDRNAGNRLKLATTRGEFSATNKYFMLFTRFTYLHSLSAKVDLQAKYQFSHHQYDQPRNVKTFINVFSAGLIFKF